MIRDTQVFYYALTDKVLVLVSEVKPVFDLQTRKQFPESSVRVVKL